jgi:acyl dehydratase
MSMGEGSAPRRSFTLAEANQLVGSELGVSDWYQIQQPQVDAFADVTDDHQWIHAESAETSAGPFGGAIAHGLLLLSLTTKFARETGAFPRDAGSCLLYGYEKVRFKAPVKVGKRVRCRSTLLRIEELQGRVILTVRFKVEVEDQPISALSADCLLVCLK